MVLLFKFNDILLNDFVYLVVSHGLRFEYFVVVFELGIVVNEGLLAFYLYLLLLFKYIK